jgi:ABC-type transporter Mla subunit MlaD
MAARSSRNNIIAGAFVLASIALAAGVVIALAGGWSLLNPTRRYTVRFSLEDGAGGVEAGSPVLLAGQPIGKVESWRFVDAPRSADGHEVAIGVDVDIQVRSDIDLYEDAVVQLIVPILGTGTKINIQNPGTGKLVTTPQGDGPRLSEGEMLAGSPGMAPFLTQAGYGPEQRQQVEKIIREISEASEKLNSIIGKVEGQVDPTTQQVQGILGDVREVTKDVRERWPGWAERVNATIASAQEFIDRFKPFADQAREGYQGVVDRIAAMVDTNRPKIDETVENARQLASKANTEGWQKVQDALASGQSGLDAFRGAAERASSLLKEQSPEIRTILANARLASDQLKLTTTEVRAAPWKLLGGPTGKKELENEVLFDAARAYALASSDLKAAAASLEALSAADGNTPGAVDRASAADLARQLDAAFSKYREAEQQFLLRLMDRK